MDEVLSGGKFNCQLGENRRALQLRRARNEGMGCGERADHRRDARERLERRGRGSCYFSVVAVLLLKMAVIQAVV